MVLSGIKYGIFVMYIYIYIRAGSASNVILNEVATEFSFIEETKRYSSTSKHYFYVRTTHIRSYW